MQSNRTSVLFVLAVLCLLLERSPIAVANPLNDTPVIFNFQTNGDDTTALAFAGSTLYVAGNFTYAGARTGSTFAIDVPGASQREPFPFFGGPTSAAIGDGSGGWFVGGAFNSVNGLSLSCVAHVRADGGLDTGWYVSLTGTVHALAFSYGVLYIGGEFVSADGGATNLIAVDAASGAQYPWSLNANGPVHALESMDGVVYVGGNFFELADQPRAGAAAITAVTGALLGWNPGLFSLAGAPEVRDLAATSGGILAGGNFSGAGGINSPYIIVLDPATATPTAWPESPNGIVNRLWSDGEVHVLLGDFTQFGSVYQPWLAMFSGDQLLPKGMWNTERPLDVAKSGDDFLLAMDNGSPGDRRGGRVSAYDLIAATNLDNPLWSIPTAGPVTYVSAQGETAWAGGAFQGYGENARYLIMAVDLERGQVSPWSPQTDAWEIGSIAVSGNRLYLSEIAGIRAVNIVTAKPVQWASGLGLYFAMQTYGENIYVCGEFNSIGGAQRKNLAALNRVTGSATSWNPVGMDLPYYMHVDETGAYISGGEEGARQVAAYDHDTGAQRWSLSLNDTCFGLARVGNLLYIGGRFTTVNDMPRARLAAVDIATGEIDSWNPTAGSVVTDVRAIGTSLYVTGAFTNIAGGSRRRLAGIDAVTGTLLPWRPAEPENVLWLQVTDYGLAMHDSKGRVRLYEFANEEVKAPPIEGRHAADYDNDGIIGLSELLRVVQFFNSGGYHCAVVDEASEDGYSANPSVAHNCRRHDTDSEAPNWKISLAELLRLIQFYNSPGYSYCPGEGTEDDFCTRSI